MVEHIKMWDVRAGATVYELSTGNNEVISLAWDASRNTLFAATQCSYLDQMGYRYSYRPARIPNRSDPEGGVENLGFYWPDRAPHTEDYYEYAFDAGEHRVCKLYSGLACRKMTNYVCNFIQINMRLRKTPTFL